MLDSRKTGVRYTLNVISHSVTLNLKLKEGPNRGMSYKLEVRVSPREYGNHRYYTTQYEILDQQEKWQRFGFFNVTP